MTAIYNLPAETVPTADGGGLWVRATVLIPPDLVETFREQATIHERQKRLGMRMGDDDPATAAVQIAVNEGLRKMRDRT